MKHKKDEILVRSLKGEFDCVNFMVNQDPNNIMNFKKVSELIREMIYEKATSKAVEIENKNGTMTYLFVVDKKYKKNAGVSQVRVVLGKDALQNREDMQDGMTMREVLETYTDKIVKMVNEKRFAKIGRFVIKTSLAAGITTATLFGIGYALDKEVPNGFDQLSPEIQQEYRERGYISENGYEKLSDELKEKISFPEFYDRFGQDVLYGEFDVSEVEQYIAEQGYTR